MTDLTIREASVEDIVSLLPLMEQLGYSKYLKSLPEHLKKCFNCEIYHSLVGEIEGNIIAISFFIIYPKCYKDANHCLLEILTVDEKYRSQGIGSKLIKQVELIAKNYNCSSISLTSNADRPKIIQEFYYNRGYYNEGSRAQIYFKKDL